MEPAVRHPVGEEEDVARLLLHHAVEALDQRAGEDARVRRQAEEPEGEEGVEALPIPHAKEAPLRVARAHALAAGDGNAEVREHALQERRVAALLVGLHGDGLAQQGIAFDLGHGVHARAGGALARHRLGPEGQRAQALEVAVAQLGPAQLAHLVGLEGVDELPAEERLVLGAADVQCWHACCAGARPPYTGRTSRGQGVAAPSPDLTGYGALPMVAPMPRARLALALCLLAACGRDESACTAPRTVTPLDPTTAGTITGTVTFAGPPPAMKPVALGGDPQCATQHQGPVLAGDALVHDGKVENAFVYVKDGLGARTFAVPETPVTIDQVGCLYEPHVAGAQTCQPIEFVNDDPTLHNVHGTPGRSAPWNFGMALQGSKRRIRVENPEVMIPVTCDVHPWMRGYLGVLPHPYFAVTGADGRFTLRGVPAGEYVLAAWHERFGTREAPLTLGAGETKDVAFAYAGGGN